MMCRIVSCEVKRVSSITSEFPWQNSVNLCTVSFCAPKTNLPLTLGISLLPINTQSLPKLMSIESVMPSNHLILCHPLLLPSSVFPSIRVFSNESVLHMRWPKYWNFSFSISPSNQDWSPLGCTGWISLQSQELSRVFSNTTVQNHQFFGNQLFYSPNSHIHTWPLEKP